jgi:hypothetical protein
LIVARKVETGEIKYFISNAAACVPLSDLLTAAFARWQIELFLRGSGHGFERAKQEAGLGAFEVRTYRSLLRHWFCSRLAMYFLAAQTQRLRGEKSADHAGASGGGDQRSGVDDVEAHLALAPFRLRFLACLWRWPFATDRTHGSLPISRRDPRRVLRWPP